MDTIPTSATQDESAPVTWRKTAVVGLYEHTPSGTYYSRFTLNGKPTFRSLKTKAFTAAKILHAKGAADRDRTRQQTSKTTSELRTLGDLADELERRIDANVSDPITKQTQRYAVTRIRNHWLGDPSKTLIRNIDWTAITAFREHLLATAKRPRGGSKTPGFGYRPAVANQTLTILRMMLGIAVENHVIPQNPFERKATLQESLFVPNRSRKPHLPSRSDMERVFAEMLIIPEETGLAGCTIPWLRIRARNCQEHARFIAYSGMRVSEANAVALDDDLGDQLRVRGPAKENSRKEYNTKTESSYRLIPVHPLLRDLMDTIKARGKTGTFLSVETSLNALERACKRLGLPKLTHHDLRHYFATICIEEGVDIPTVSRWLGHSDGGTLAMRTYGHLRQEHSIAAMKRVSFAPRVAQSNGASPAPA